MTESHDDKPHAPAPSLWPIGFAIGIACILVGLVVSAPALIVGVVIAVVFGWLWARDVIVGRTPVPPAAPAETPPAETEPVYVETYDRSGFLSVATIGLGGVIGAAVTVPVLGFGVLPSFNRDDIKSHDVDLGPLSNFPEGKYVIATYTENPAIGQVSRRTAYVRNNGFTEDGQPSFSALFSRCVHLGCPVQPNGPREGEPSEYRAGDAPPVTLQPVLAASFGCPCHGGLYDGEGNRTAGPPVRALDRFEFKIVDGNLVLGRIFSVGEVDGAGAKARLTKYRRSAPGVHVDGVESWLYPIPTPGSS